nr:vegetative incompatibility protein het-e-1 [Quercus suber]
MLLLVANIPIGSTRDRFYAEPASGQHRVSMRLLQIGSYVPGDRRLEIVQKWGKDIPPYAILSHTWSTNPDDEVLFSDVQQGTCASKPAFGKLAKAMERAQLDGYSWLWCDTCCIDKTSSVELTEAINSMYSYYKESHKCYTYLSDVDGEALGEEFKQSRWWKRGWTLQELLAPGKLEFFTSEWKSMGFKDSLHEIVTVITGIDQDYLNGSSPLEHASIAKRMSWAACRETTREEDIAYSLIGIFDVNMPMLYGEGARRAFVRLQEEIMKGDEDQSLFAWVKNGDWNGDYHGLLADSPKDFECTGHAIPYTDLGGYNPSTMTARGLNITLPLTSKTDAIVVAALNCPVPGRGYNDWLAVYLQRLHTGTDQYARVDCTKLASVAGLGKPQQVYVRQRFPRFTSQVIYPYHFFQLRSFMTSSEYPELIKYKIIDVRYANQTGHGKVAPTAQLQPWSLVPMVYRIDKSADALTTAFLIERTSDHEAFLLMLGTSSNFGVGVGVYEADVFGPVASLQNLFVPQRPGLHIDLEYHRVRITIEEHVRVDQKIYFVDIEINGLPKPPTAAELLQGAADVLASPRNSAVKVGFRDKVKRLLP